MGALAETARYVCLVPVNPTQRQTQEKVVAEGTSISVEEQKCQLKIKGRLLSDGDVHPRR